MPYGDDSGPFGERAMESLKENTEKGAGVFWSVGEKVVKQSLIETVKAVLGSSQFL